jgi:hypothetical protein
VTDQGGGEDAGRRRTRTSASSADSEVTMIRTYGAHERISVKRASAEEGTQ